MILKGFSKDPASLSKDPKEYSTLLFTVDKNANPVTMRFTKSHY